MSSSEARNRASKAYRQRKLKQGLCPVCGKETDGYYCDYHRAKNNGYSKTLRKNRKENGQCTKCSAPLDPDIDAGHTTCINCRERFYFI